MVNGTKGGDKQKGIDVISPDRGENQREKSKVFPLLVSPYYTTPNYTQGHYSVCTDPALCGPLTDPGCMYTSYFTSMVTPEVKVEWSSNLRVEWSLEMGVERSSNLEAEWNLEQQKCEMGDPPTHSKSKLKSRLVLESLELSTYQVKMSSQVTIIVTVTCDHHIICHTLS